MVRRAVLLAFLVLAACAGDDDLEGPPPDLGAFRLGHTVVLSDDVQYGPFSREIDANEIEEAVRGAVARRFGPARYDGDGLYHLGILVGGLVLAAPGIPAVYTPSSAMVFDVTVFDNATRQRLNEEPKRILVREGFSNWVPVIGSGLARGADAQLENLAENAARAIEGWLLDNPDWFVPTEGLRRTPFPGDRSGEPSEPPALR